jgi:hypothetical protein
MSNKNQEIDLERLNVVPIAPLTLIVEVANQYKEETHIEGRNPISLKPK